MKAEQSFKSYGLDCSLRRWTRTEIVELGSHLLLLLGISIH